MKLRIALIVLIAVLIGISAWLNGLPQGPERVQLPLPVPPTEKKHKKATLTPGRVVQLQTVKGEIDFVLFEKDCPKTTARIIKLVEDGAYNRVAFTRVEKDTLIQTDLSRKKVETMGCEVADGLDNVKGAVGMARKSSYDSVESSFYILLEPLAHLNQEYTVFGRLIKGMDVAMKIKKNDDIKSARIREFTPADRKLFDEVLRIEVERKVD